MAFAGLKKQINKANQYMTEKMGGAEGTKLDDEQLVEMERKTDVTFELVDELQLKTKEFLQPNPTARAKMAAVKGIGKLSGQAKASTYPQAEGILGDCMLHYGKKMGDESIFGQALIEVGDAMKQMADVKYSLDDNIKQNFLEPLHHLQMKDLKEVMHHRKKLQGRRLDFDCKRRCQAKDDEIRQAEEKFAESLHLAQMGMYNLLENDIEQVAQLATFSEGLLEYHQQCVEILRTLCERLMEKKEEAANRPKDEFQPKTLSDLRIDAIHLSGDGMNGNKRSQLDLFPANQPPSSTNASPLASPSVIRSPAKTPMQPQPGQQQQQQGQPGQQPQQQQQQRQPCCTALYDFEPENPGELGFKENDTITLIKKIDDNWYEGTVNGRTGYFPVSYVQVVVPLP
ncbi:endophilin-A [Trichogramma pretiosum]|uniref:endophilin-A n=1 Tax=Trichogramma pretiosum TaxID=7493 RepID=UPI0006C9BF68|nr:endophilin-A [Trichogramma pretiosum]XP_014224118.1 endophilin-A [Trichogramma pretiosum]XP_014224119.1 endophilin-A [Trichogramma pretiosum]XP_014224120.1 endophilin-A [Trichogramma pretiosum]XP_023317477.1 endophilin-A [Trichogramma pretiosum]